MTTGDRSDRSDTVIYDILFSRRGDLGHAKSREFRAGIRTEWHRTIALRRDQSWGMLAGVCTDRGCFSAIPDVCSAGFTGGDRHQNACSCDYDVCGKHVGALACYATDDLDGDLLFVAVGG